MSFRRAWTRFCRRPRTWGPTPGVREAWHQGRRWYHVSVLLLDDPRVVARRDELAAALAGWVDPFSQTTPHVTVWVHGFEAPVTHPPPEDVPVVVAGANSFASCPFLEAWSPELRRLRAGFSGTEERWAAYLPHLTLGRYHGHHETRALVHVMRASRRLPRLYATGRLSHRVVDAWSESGELFAPPLGSPQRP